MLHAKRALFVAKMWRSTPTAWLELPEITEFGWEADGSPIWIEEAFPDDVSLLLLTENGDEDEGEEGDDTSDEEDYGETTNDENEEDDVFR